MTRRRQQRLLRGLGAGLILGGTGLAVRLAWALPAWTPPELKRTTTSAPAKPRVTPRESDLSVIWTRDLRQELLEKAPPPAAPVSPEPPLAVRLLATAVEEQRRYGIFQLVNGQTVVRAVGGDVGGYALLGIERGAATLQKGERQHTLRVPWYDRLPRGDKE